MVKQQGVLDFNPTDMKLSILIPVYNEIGNITPLFERLDSILPIPGHKFEVILVNDGSTDGSGILLDSKCKNNKQYKVIHFRRNFGQTAAMMAGIDYATGDIIIPMDGDLQNDPGDIPLLLNKLMEGFDVVSGWRKNRKDNPISRNFPSLIANRIISRISGVRLHDYGCTLKAYRKEVIKDVDLYGEMHRFIPIYAFINGAKVTEIEVSHQERKSGKSKYGMERIIKVILDLIVVKFLIAYSQKPIYAFGGFGILSFIGALLTFIMMLYFKYIEGVNFNRTPLPNLATLFTLTGFQSIFMGLIAELLMRTYYESQNKRAYKIDRIMNLKKSGR